MPIYYWKRINPAKILVPAYRDSEYLDDDLKDIAGCLLRRARYLTDRDFNVFRAAELFQKIVAWLQYLRCAELLVASPPGSEQYARLQAATVEWQRAYSAIDVGDAWERLMSAARSSRTVRTQEGVAKPPTLDEVRQRLDTPVPTTPTPPTPLHDTLVSPAGTPMGGAHRDAPQGVVVEDPVWGKPPEGGEGR